MEPAALGLVLDASVLIEAERRDLTAAEAIKASQGPSEHYRLLFAP